ncbi:MAG: hypothetical protein KDB97_12990, partial [Flavobacteriales bacterium]|nr:hypothetical protein [Flavobacteriales bacterium]
MKCSDSRPRKRHVWGALLAAMLGPAALVAQPTVDIGLFESGTPGTLEVRVLPDGSFNQLMSSLTFTIRWSTASGASLNTAAMAQNCPGGFFISPSGDGEVDFGGFRYLTFNAFGFAQMSAACPGAVWTANTESVIMTIPVINNPGCTDFNIVNDTYTGNNNKDYYISLNGLDKTGAIYSSPFSVGNCALDCEGVPGGSALPGTSCDDGDPNTTSDTWDANCVCSGISIFDCPNLMLNIGDACDDGDAGTYNDLVDANCVCAGTPYDCPNLMANIGDACDDGDPNTTGDAVDANCVCTGSSVFDCPNLMLNIGDACDDGDAGTYNDLVDANCVCA